MVLPPQTPLTLELFQRGLSKKLKALSMNSVLTAEVGTTARAASATKASDLFILNFILVKSRTFALL